MRPYRIFTDSCCDLDAEMANKINVEVLPLKFTVNGRGYANYLDGRDMTSDEFFKLLRSGAEFKTSAINIGEFEDAFTEAIKNGEDVIYIGFSSAMSSTYSSAKIASEELSEKYPDSKIYAIDSLCGSVGQGLMCYLASQKAKEGATIDELRDYVEQTKGHLCHWFSVDDLNFLKRGGRVSAAAALVGSVLGIKPVLHNNDNGMLVRTGIVRGRAQALKAIVDKMESLAVNPSEQTVFIGHTDCIDDALSVKADVMERFGIPDEKVYISCSGPVISSHTGPGTIAVFFIGTER